MESHYVAVIVVVILLCVWFSFGDIRIYHLIITCALALVLLKPRNNVKVGGWLLAKEEKPPWKRINRASAPTPFDRGNLTIFEKDIKRRINQGYDYIKERQENMNRLLATAKKDPDAAFKKAKDSKTTAYNMQDPDAYVAKLAELTDKANADSKLADRNYAKLMLDEKGIDRKRQLVGQLIRQQTVNDDLLQRKHKTLDKTTEKFKSAIKQSEADRVAGIPSEAAEAVNPLWKQQRKDKATYRQYNNVNKRALRSFEKHKADSLQEQNISKLETETETDPDKIELPEKHSSEIPRKMPVAANAKIMQKTTSESVKTMTNPNTHDENDESNESDENEYKLLNTKPNALRRIRKKEQSRADGVRSRRTGSRRSKRSREK